VRTLPPTVKRNCEDVLSIREAATGKELLAIGLYAHHVVEMDFSPDGTRLATAGGEDEELARGGGAKLWDLAAGQEVLSLGSSTDVVTHIAFFPDGRRIVSTRVLGGAFGFFGMTNSGELEIWNAAGSNATDGEPAPAAEPR
jgi:WD40 repeat protein